MVRTLAFAAILLASASADAQVAPGPVARRHGLTFDASVGLGSFRGSKEGAVMRGAQMSLAGPNLGVGWFVNHHLAVGARVAGVYHRAGTGEFLATAFAGPTAQIWVAPYAWIGAGAGVGMVADPSLTLYEGGIIEQSRAFGFALDARLGLTFNPQHRHTVNVALELIPVFAFGTTYTGLGILAGYQFL